MAANDPPSRVRDRKRPHDIVLWGATGFTGKLVAEYLVRNVWAKGNPQGLRLALAGRNRDKLEAVRSDLAVLDGGEELPILLGDSHDRGSMQELASRASVVCSTVGPYAKYGAELVAACVEHGTDYCDLTGEVQFMRRTIDEHHEQAQKTGARIVHCCGFDSIPSDLGTLMMQEAMKKRHGGTLHEVKFFAGESKGTFSGGTVASMLNLLEEAKHDRGMRRLLADPYALNPEGERQGPDGKDQQGVRFDPDLQMWTGPFVMASVNTRLVRRSHALLGYPWGRDFRYSEAMSFGKGAKGLALATGVTAALGGFMAAMNIEPTKKLLQKRLPSPGDGPSREQREAGYFVIRLIGKGRDRDGREVELRGRVEGQADPGYGETAKMLGESALCLALDGADLQAPGGVRTPASTMGMRLIERLRAAGMVFEVDGEPV